MANQRKKNIKTVSIGIPVYNEQDNIIVLLDQIIKYKFDKFNLLDVIIYDDKSTDSTLEKVRLFKSKHPEVAINLITAKINKGKAAALTVIMKSVLADYLITLDSDVTLTDATDLESLIASVDEDPSVGMASGWYDYRSQRGMIAKVFNFSGEVLLNLGLNHKFYVCWGGLMVLRSEYARKIEVPEGLHRIDGFLYLKCIELQYRYIFRNDIRVLDNKDFSSIGFSKYLNIQKRSNSFPANYEKLYKGDIYAKEVTLNFSNKLTSFIKAFIKYPSSGTVYLIVKSLGFLYSSINRKKSFGLWRK
jgi:glycosyltransferase involved in cell wall biosynthesis